MCVSAQSCPVLNNFLDYGPPSSLVHGIFQARILKWDAISFSRASSPLRDQTHMSCISCTDKQILYHCTAWKALKFMYLVLFLHLKKSSLICIHLCINMKKKFTNLYPFMDHYDTDSWALTVCVISPETSPPSELFFLTVFLALLECLFSIRTLVAAMGP